MLTRDVLFSCFTRRYLDVPTPAGVARIQNLNEDELCEFQAGQLDREGRINESYQRQKRRRLVAMVLVDADGKRILDQPGDITRLGPAADSAVITAIFLAALDHCGLTKLESDAENLEKNSEPTAA